MSWFAKSPLGGAAAAEEEPDRLQNLVPTSAAAGLNPRLAQWKLRNPTAQKSRKTYGASTRAVSAPSLHSTMADVLVRSSSETCAHGAQQDVTKPTAKSIKYGRSRTTGSTGMQRRPPLQSIQNQDRDWLDERMERTPPSELSTEVSAYEEVSPEAAPSVGGKRPRRLGGASETTSSKRINTLSASSRPRARHRSPSPSLSPELPAPEPTAASNQLKQTRQRAARQRDAIKPVLIPAQVRTEPGQHTL